MPKPSICYCAGFTEYYLPLSLCRIGPDSSRKGRVSHRNQTTDAKRNLPNLGTAQLCSVLLSLASTPIQRSKGRRYPLYSLLLSRCRQLLCLKTIFPCFRVQHQLRAVALLLPLRCGAQGLLTEINECVMPPTSQAAAKGPQRSGLIDQEQ